MNKAVKTSVIFIVLVLIISLSVWAGFEDLLIDPATPTGSGGGAVNIIGKLLNAYDIKNYNHFDFYQNDDSNKFDLFRSLLAVPNEMSGIMHQSLTASLNKPGPDYSEASVSISAVVIPKKTRGYRDTTSGDGSFLTAMTPKEMNQSIGMGVFTDAREAVIYSPSSTGFGMVKKVLEPSTMLLLGSCLLCIGLFAIKFRK